MSIDYNVTTEHAISCFVNEFIYLSIDHGE